MRQVSATEKYRAVNEGRMAKSEFVRQMKQQFPQFVSNYDSYDSTVKILKYKGMIFETKVEKEITEGAYEQRPVLNYSLDALDRGIRVELSTAGVEPGAAAIKKEVLAAATKKAQANLEKNPNHYLDLLSGESQKVDKNDKFKETKRGALDKDTFNDMKKAALKEGYTEEQINAAIQKIKEKKEVSIAEEPVSVKENVKQVASVIKKQYGEIPGFDSLLKDYLQTHLKDITDGLVDDPIADFNDFVDLNYDRLDEKDHDGYNTDPNTTMHIDDEEWEKENGRGIKEGRGDMEQIFSIIEDRASDSGFDVEEEAMEVMEAIGQEYEIDFEFGAGPSRQMQEKKGKDHDGDGDVDGDDYMAAKDKAIKKAMGKDEQLKEAIKSIIIKTLNEDSLNEAATANLSSWGEDYQDFEGVKSVVHDLENIVTEIESFYDKMGDKIAKVFERSNDFRNEEGLKVGAFIAPGLEATFRKDLVPVLKKGFFDKIVLPKVRTISQADIDAHNSGERPLGEVEIEAPKQNVFSPLAESKKK